MVLTLIKNELIKISKRGKTWIVFGMFILAMIGLIVVGKVGANESKHWNSPQGQIEIIDKQLKWQNEDLKSSEAHLKSLENNKTKNKSEIISTKERIAFAKDDIKRLKEDRKLQEKLINAKTPDWREEVKASIKNLNSEKEKAKREGNADKKYLDSLNKQIDINQYFLDNNLKPVKKWEFYPSNLAIQVMMIFSMAMLVAGIAVFMSDIISGECTPATLKFLLVQPISRGKVILSKFVAIVITVVMMICGSELIAFGAVGAFTGFDAIKMPVELGLRYKVNQEILMKEGFKQLDLVANSGYNSNMGDFVLQSFLLQILFVVACCAFIFMISSLFKSSMITMAVSVVISIAAVILPTVSKKIGEYAHLNFLNYGNTPGVISGDIAHIYANTNFTPGLGATLMVITIIVSYIIAHVVFSKRDMLV